MGPGGCAPRPFSFCFGTLTTVALEFTLFAWTMAMAAITVGACRLVQGRWF